MKTRTLPLALAAVTSMAVLAGQPYPKAQLNEFWETVLINQFHDILPGTSIEEVYVDSDSEYGTLFSTLDSANGPWHSAAGAALKAAKNELRLVNFLSHDRDALVSVPGATGGSLTSGGEARALQQLVRADGSTVMAAPVANLPALGWQSAAVTEAVKAPRSTVSASKTRLENALIRVTFDSKGEISSVLDKASGRELIQASETANRLVAYEDKPLNWDAWDIDHYFHEQAWPLADAKCPA